MLLGCPSSVDAAQWEQYRQVVSGRLVNGFSMNDGVLCYLHRVDVRERRGSDGQTGTLSVAGLQKVEVKGVENVDLSLEVQSHSDYMTKIRTLLILLRFGQGYD